MEWRPRPVYRASARQLRRVCRPAIASFAVAILALTPARAHNAAVFLHDSPDNSSLAGISAVVALVLITTITALLHLTGRKTWLRRETSLMADLAEARTKLDRANIFLAAERQITVAWGDPATQPEIEGDLSLVTDAPAPRRVLGFGAWLAPETAQQLERCIERLRERGEAFRLPIASLSKRFLEVEGRAIGGKAVMRIRDVSGDRLELTRLRERHGQCLTEVEAFRAMLDAVPSPAWLRDAGGRLAWVNAAYARAVEAPDAACVVREGTELLERPARDAALLARQASHVWRGQVAAIVAGQRHKLDVVDVPSSAGSAGIAADLSELVAMREDLARQVTAHSRTLDQLATAVAIFDGARRLVFHNAAYRQLWQLDAGFLEHNPTDHEILDRLRAERRLPEQADFRAWKSSLMSLYQAMEAEEQTWHLPDGRTLRTVISPNPQGGVTYLYDDVSERVDLASKYNGLIRVQGETLDTLKEGVAVFGADGRIKLFNPAFAQMWRLDPALLARGADARPQSQPHIDQVARLCALLLQGDDDLWTSLRSIIAGLHDARTGFAHKLERIDGMVLECAAAPLPDGATLLTFTDITAAAQVERALTDRNQALMDAEKLRNDFVHHVSYELRSPLTNIIGFTQLLGDGTVGALNPKQAEYADYVLKSSAALLAIINDILDLATIDVDAMELVIGDVDIVATMHEAAVGVQDRLAESGIHLQIVALDGLAPMRADGKRLRQVLFNLLSNAIGFSSAGQTVTLAAMQRGGDVVFKVTDQGRGIPPDVIAQVFDRFRSHTIGSRHRGVGLGLSIVRAFVELHGGTVHVESVLGEGTVVTCTLPVVALAKAGQTRAPRATPAPAKSALPVLTTSTGERA